MKKIITVFVFLITVIIFGQEKQVGKVYDGWEFIKTLESGTEYYFKVAKENYIWYNVVFTKTREEEGVDGKIKSNAILFRVDCKGKVIGEKGLVLYDEEGNVLYEEQRNFFEYSTKMPAPNSADEFFMNFYCCNIKNRSQLVESSEDQTTNYYGNTKVGSGGNYNLAGRKALSKPKKQPDCQEEGIVVVRITVNKNGQVIKAVPGVKGSTTTAECLLKPAKEAALQTTWNSDDKAPSNQVGTLIYKFSITN